MRTMIFLNGVVVGLIMSFVYFNFSPILSRIPMIENRNVAKPKIRLACLIHTMKSTHRNKASAVKSTWGRRCDHLVFLSDSVDESLPTVVLNFTGRKYLWGKTKATMRYAKKYLDGQADWFLKADDDTYIVVENLLNFLDQYDHHSLIYAGCQFGLFSPKGYMTGGSGYLLSSSALDSFSKYSDYLCKPDDEGDEDVEMGRCMYALNVTFVDGSDHLGRLRFLPLTPGTHLTPGALNSQRWIYDYTTKPLYNNWNCCSEDAISFHYITPEWMYAVEYLIYHHRITSYF